jgi:hypothetical protein
LIANSHHCGVSESTLPESGNRVFQQNRPKADARNRRSHQLGE